MYIKCVSVGVANERLIMCKYSVRASERIRMASMRKNISWRLHREVAVVYCKNTQTYGCGVWRESEILRASAKLRKATVYVCPSVILHGTAGLPLDGFS